MFSLCHLSTLINNKILIFTNPNNTKHWCRRPGSFDYYFNMNTHLNVVFFFLGGGGGGFPLWDATMSTTQTSCPQYLSHTHLHSLPSNFTMLCFLINFSSAWNPLEAISPFTKHPGTPVGEGEDDSGHNTCMRWFSYTPMAVLWLLVNICYIWAYVLLAYF